MSKKPYRPVTDIDIMADIPPASEAVASESEQPSPAAPPITPAESASASSDSVPPPPARRQVAYRPTVEVAERLRLISFQQRRPVNDLIDEAVMFWLSGQR